MSSSIHFLIDYREQNLIEHIQSEYPMFKFECSNLILGDIQIIIDDKLSYIIERKTYADLLASITDGRYRDQAMRLCKLSPDSKIIMLIEGGITHSNKTIISCLATFTCFNMSVIHTGSIMETTHYLQNVNEKLRSDKPEYHRGGGDISLCRGKNRVCIKDVSDTYKVILKSIPRISKKVIVNIMEKYPSLFALKNISSDELMKIKQIGKTTAEKIVAIIKEIYKEPTPHETTHASSPI